MNDRYLKHERGQIIILAAVMLVILVAVVGLAIDSGRGYGVKAKLNAAVDAGAIAGARALAEGADDAARLAAAQAAARNFYYANYPVNYLGSTVGSPSINAVHESSGYWRVNVSGTATMNTTLMRILGFEVVPVVAVGQAIRRDLDIILVLDTSGSLGPPTSPSTTLPRLKQAAIRFIDRFNAGNNGDRVGLVSFASGAVVDVPIIKDGSRGFNRTAVVNAINALTVTGSTASSEGMRRALNEINGVPPASRSSLRVIAFFSDGAPNDVSATFLNNSNPVTGDLYSETVSPATARADRVFRHDHRDTQLGTYSNIASLPNSGFVMNGLGNIPLASFNNKRTLAGNPYTNTRCNVNKAARNMVENVANTARIQDINIHSIGLGTRVDSLEITFCAYNSSEHGSNILKRIANTADSDTYNSSHPTGLYAWAASDSELDAAFDTIASEILRLTR